MTQSRHRGNPGWELPAVKTVALVIKVKKVQKSENSAKAMDKYEKPAGGNKKIHHHRTSQGFS